MPRFGPPRIEDELEELAFNESRIVSVLRALSKSLNQKMDLIMAEIDDLNTAVDKMTAAVNVAITDIKTISDELTAANASGDKAAIEAAAQKLSALADSLSAATPSDG